MDTPGQSALRRRRVAADYRAAVARSIGRPAAHRWFLLTILRLYPAPSLRSGVALDSGGSLHRCQGAARAARSQAASVAAQSLLRLWYAPPSQVAESSLDEDTPSLEPFVQSPMPGLPTAVEPLAVARGAFPGPGVASPVPAPLIVLHVLVYTACILDGGNRRMIPEVFRKVAIRSTLQTSSRNGVNAIIRVSHSLVQK